MVKGSRGLIILTHSTSSRQRARETYAKGTGILPRMVGEQPKADGKFHQ